MELAKQVLDVLETNLFDKETKEKVLTNLPKNISDNIKLLTSNDASIKTGIKGSKDKSDAYGALKELPSDVFSLMFNFLSYCDKQIVFRDMFWYKEELREKLTYLILYAKATITDLKKIISEQNYLELYKITKTVGFEVNTFIYHSNKGYDLKKILIDQKIGYDYIVKMFLPNRSAKGEDTPGNWYLGLLMILRYLPIDYDEFFSNIFYHKHSGIPPVDIGNINTILSKIEERTLDLTKKEDSNDNVANTIDLKVLDRTYKLSLSDYIVFLHSIPLPSRFKIKGFSDIPKYLIDVNKLVYVREPLNNVGISLLKPANKGFLLEYEAPLTWGRYDSDSLYKLKTDAFERRKETLQKAEKFLKETAVVVKFPKTIFSGLKNKILMVDNEVELNNCENICVYMLNNSNLLIENSSHCAIYNSHRNENDVFNVTLKKVNQVAFYSNINVNYNLNNVYDFYSIQRNVGCVFLDSGRLFFQGFGGRTNTNFDFRLSKPKNTQSIVLIDFYRIDGYPSTFRYYKSLTKLKKNISVMFNNMADSLLKKNVYQYLHPTAYTFFEKK